MTEKDIMPATRILIVEDSAIQAEMLRRLLIREGYEVFVARDGSEGLDMAQKHSPALIISDINMPVMNGHEMCGKIKDDERLRDMPVMLLTQLIDHEEVLRGLESGADAYVTKPYDEEFLLARVHLMLEMPDSFKNIPDRKCIEFEYQKKHYVVRSGRSRTLSFLLSTYENALWHSLKLLKIQEELKKFNELLEEKVKVKTAELEAELAERQNTEAELRDSENRFRSLVQTAPVVILHLSPEGKILEFNPEAERIYGCRREEALGRDYPELFIPAEAREGVREDFKKVLAGMPTMNYENPVKTTANGIRHFSWNVNRLIDDKGVPTGIVAVGIDITAHKQAENMMLKYNQDLLSFVYLSNELIGTSLIADIYKTICDLTVRNFDLRMAWLGTIEEGSHEIKIMAFSGFEDDYLSNVRITQADSQAGEAIRSKIPNVVNSIDISPLYAGWRDEALKKGYHSYMALPLISSEGRVFGVLNLYSDKQMFFTEKLMHILEVFANQVSVTIENSNLIKGLEEKIMQVTQAEDEVRKLNAELEQRVLERTVQLEAANKSLETFSYSVSHDLRVPLRAITGFSGILMEDYTDKLDDEGKRLLNVVKNNAQNMGRLIDDILAFSRAGRKELQMVEIDMEGLARDVVEELRPTFADRKVQIEIKPLLPAKGDRAALYQVFTNLISNAVKFTRGRETAVIEIGNLTSPQSSSLAGEGKGEGEISNQSIYYIKDNGTGFDMENAGKLFGVFQRLHSAEEFEGSGVGLSIVKAFITKHGGRVWAEGKVNEGAMFYFTLPKLPEMSNEL